MVVVGHHPLKSNGEHGGRFTLKDHIFPLTAKFPNAYIPLPGLGSIYPLYRSMLGDKQDIQHRTEQFPLDQLKWLIGLRKVSSII
ncbi:MAG: hypothetical protein O2867_09045 [Bacteroidetes bacterium]|nr:hypothetical protein [Bacteroidota bacterium]MDA0973867.1 hypothetical protein [Bacteroidota bacterium]